jgi:DNA-binding Lrp family transcriptional regulator
LIRKNIIRLYQEHGHPVPLTDIAQKLGSSTEALAQELARTEKLGDLQGLGIKQAGELIQFYGKDMLFAKSVVDDVEQYLAVRSRIEAIERKVKRK